MTHVVWCFFLSTCFASKLHVDAHNVGPSYIIGLGNYDATRHQRLWGQWHRHFCALDPWCSWTWKWNVLHACTAESESTAIGSLKTIKNSDWIADCDAIAEKNNLRKWVDSDWIAENRTAIGSLTAIRSQHSTQRLDRWSKQRLDRWPAHGTLFHLPCYVCECFRLVNPTDVAPTNLIHIDVPHAFEFFTLLAIHERCQLMPRWSWYANEALPSIWVLQVASNPRKMPVNATMVMVCQRAPWVKCMNKQTISKQTSSSS